MSNISFNLKLNLFLTFSSVWSNLASKIYFNTNNSTSNISAYGNLKTQYVYEPCPNKPLQRPPANHLPNERL